MSKYVLSAIVSETKSTPGQNQERDVESGKDYSNKGSGKII